MGIVREVAGDAQVQQQVEQDFRMTLARRHDPNPRMVEPLTNAADRFRHRHGVLNKYLAVS